MSSRERSACSSSASGVMPSSSECQSTAEYRCPPRRGLRSASGNCSVSHSVKPMTDVAAARVSDSSPATSATSPSMSASVPASWAIAVSTWTRGMTPSSARASTRNLGIAARRPRRDSARTSIGAKSRMRSRWSAVPGFQSMGFQVVARSSVISKWIRDS